MMRIKIHEGNLSDGDVRSIIERAFRQSVLSLREYLCLCDRWAQVRVPHAPVCPSQGRGVWPQQPARHTEERHLSQNPSFLRINTTCNIKPRSIFNRTPQSVNVNNAQVGSGDCSWLFKCQVSGASRRWDHLCQVQHISEPDNCVWKPLDKFTYLRLLNAILDRLPF